MTLAAGTRLGPYEILASLGAGGMGEVFRARDTRLGRDVAVKVLPERLAGDPKALRRFKSEAKVVAALSHPRILALYDVGETDGIPWAVTELLEGETLRGVVSGGPIPVTRALEIAAHVADALAAAHEKGIVHRDVKPENVFLTRDGHVKLLDFGLSRHENAFRSIEDSHTPTVSARTEAGAVLGTIAYMSPEQARGLPVDHRTDHFSLGVTLYEMLAGSRPFRGETGADVLAAIIKEDPPPLSSRVEGLPPPLLALLDRCLSKEPRDRYASTRDLARDLAAWHEQASSAADARGPASRVAAFAPESALASAGRPPAASRRLVATVAAGTLVIAVSAGLWLWQGAKGGPSPASRPDAPPSAAAASSREARLDPQRVAVAVFENRTGDPSLDGLGRMAAEWITEGISGIRIDVVPSSDVFDVPGTPATGGVAAPRESFRGMAERTGAGLVVSGAYDLAGSDVRVQAQVSEIATGKLLRALAPATAPRSDPMPAVDALRRQVRDVVAARLNALPENVLSTEATPPKYEAFQEYLLGWEKFGVDAEAAESHFRRALEIDPDFVLPRFLLASNFRNQGRWEEAARETAQLDARRSSLTAINRTYVDSVLAIMAGRYDEVLAALKEAAKLSPGDVDNRFCAGLNALWANRPREAVELLTAPVRWELMATPSRPFGVSYFDVLAKSHHALGRHDEELAAVRRGVATYTARPALLLLAEARALVPLGRLAEAERLFEEALRRPDEASLPGRLMLEAAAELRGHGRADEARAMAARAVERVLALPDGKRGPDERKDLAVALLAAERWKEALPLLATVANEQPREAVKWKGLRGLAALRSGDEATANRIDEELRRLERPYLFGEHFLYRAALAAARGEKARSVDLLRQALAAGYLGESSNTSLASGASFWAHRAIELAPLIGYPPFEELVKPKG